MHVFICYTQREKEVQQRYHSPQVGIYKRTFRYCKYERRTIDSEKGQDLSFKECYSLLNFQFIAEKRTHMICHFPSKLVHYVWYVISLAFVMEIRRNNTNTCTTAQETLYKKITSYKIQSDHTNEPWILHIYFSCFIPCSEDEGEPRLRSKLRESIAST